MKKLKFFVVLFFVMCTMAIFASCGGKLDAPTGVMATEENEIAWSPVEDAYRYIVQFKSTDNDDKPKELKTKESKISVSEFELDEGWYDVRVMAVSGEKDANNSTWSEALRYYKIYESGCSFTLVNNVEYHVTGSVGANGDVIIESTYNDKPVTRIAEGAFKTNTRVTSVTIGEYVQAIDKNAFYGCSQLKSVTLPKSLKTIGESAFQSCRELKSIAFFDELISIEKSAFSYCRKLQTIDFGTSVMAIGESAFYGCSVLEKIEIPDSVVFIGEKAFSNCESAQSVHVGKGVTEIGARTFYENTLLDTITFADGIQLEMIGDLAFAYATKVKKVVVPNGVEYIGDSTFQGCEELKDITIPNTITHIGSYAFGGTKYYKDLVDDPANTLYYLGNWVIGVQVDADETDDVDNSFKSTVVNITPETFKEGVVGIADLVLYRCPELRTVTLPDSLKYIGDYAFYQCPKLYLVTTHCAETVGDYAFAEAAISNLNLGTKLKSIGSYAFYKCLQLENNTQHPIVPDSVTRIGQLAFEGSGLWNKPEEDGVVYAGSWIVGYVGSVREVNVKPGTVGISDYAFYMAQSLESISGLASGVKNIGRGAFFGCTRLGTIALCDDMEKIEDYSFYACANLLEVTLPQNLKTIGRSAFYDCAILSYVDLSSLLYLEEIDQFAFANCVNLAEVDFGYTLKTIDNYAFYKCYSLEKIELPDTVETIGSYAFYNNYYSYENDAGELIQKGLKSISFDRDTTDSYESQLKTIGDYAFTGCQLLEEIALPNSLTSVGTSAFYNCVSVQSVNLGDNLEKIGAYAFFGLEKPTSLQLPKTLNEVGMYAFKGWSGITSLVLPSTVGFVGDHAFYGCYNATMYTEMTAEEMQWSLRWNSSYRPVVFGAELSEDKSYVLSLTITENTFSNLRAESVIAAPTRENHIFKGWALTENGAVVYAANEITNLAVGTTIYAVWETIA